MGYDGPAPYSVRVFSREGRLAELFDDKGAPIKELQPPRQVAAASPGTLLILDISPRPLQPLGRLSNMRGLTDYAIMRCLPKELPDSVAGLEMADIVIWDAPDPTSLDPQQSQALLEWIRRGGRLIVGVGKDWNVLSASKFGPLLPGRLGGTRSSADTDFLKPLIRPPEDIASAPPTPKSVTFCPFTSASLAADATPILPPSLESDQQVWLARRPCGRGEILLAPIELQEMLAIDTGNESLLKNSLLSIRPGRDPNSQSRGGLIGQDVFSPVAAQTAFQTTSGLYFAFAFAFVIAYIAIVTGGSWAWLKHRGAVRHAWVIFAALAGLASGASLVAVQFVRVLGQGVHEMTIVDGRAGSFETVATSYLGFKTASHTLVDLCVPSKWLAPAEAPETRASLRPKTSEATFNQDNTFSVPQKYEAAAQIGELRSVPLRATLKQFEATWRGELTGRLLSSLRRRATPREAQLDASSWIDNQLGVSLHDCYVITRTSGAAQPVVYMIPQFDAGQRVNWATVSKFMDERYKATLKARLGLLGRDPAASDDEKEWSPPVLRVLLGQCLDRIGIGTARDADERRKEQELLSNGSPSYVSALLTLTFLGDSGLRLLLQDQELTCSEGQDLDVSSKLDKNTALFVGFSDEPGPLRLCRRKPGADVESWKPIKPSQSAVMYRFMMPVQ